jgi:hypothetical protein
MSDYPGGDTLGVVTDVASGQTDSLNQPILTESVVWVYGCVFETYMYGISEQETDITTSQEKAFAYFPYVSGVGIPGVDANGASVAAVIDNNSRIRPQRPDAEAQRDYKVFGLPAEQYDIEGLPDHVLVVCVWQGG